MSAFKPQQYRLTIGERAFHFVSYEAEIANPAKNKEGHPEMWYLMVAGRRFPSLPCDHGQSASEVERSLIAWAHANAIGSGPVEAPPRAPRYRTLE